MRVAIYSRASTDEQAQSGTIQNHMDFAHRYCELHGLKAYDVYPDDGVSGTVPLVGRPAGGRLVCDEPITHIIGSTTPRKNQGYLCD